MKHYRQHFGAPGIRMQVMLWYLLVFVVLLLGSDLALYIGMKHSLETNLDTTLQLQAQQLADGISNERNAIQVNTEIPGLDTTGTSPQGSPQTDDVNFGALARLLNVQGQIIGISPAFRTLIVPAISITQPLHGSPWQGTVSSTSGQQVRLYSMVLTNNGKTFAVLQVGISLEQQETTLRSLLLQLLLLVPLLLALGAVGSYWLAARALRPIDALTHTAQTIEAGDLHHRVPVPPTRDEVYRLASTFNMMLERLDAAFARQRRFVADASHELRTPTAVICNMAEMTLLNAATREEYAATLQTIMGESQRLGHLVNDLLALARTDEGQTRLEREPIRLDMLVQAVVTHLQTLAEERQITLEIQTGEAITLCGDEARLIQVFLNLGENALYYTNPGGHICFTARIVQEQACLVIKDTGIGIEEEHLPHIFERFYRVDPARVQAEKSHCGLGLSIAEWVVRAHGGTISVESQVGQGSTFTVILPLISLTDVHSSLLHTAATAH
ncbi:MAG TPA: HAMP domain-containing sensor histidine kinase [Ktedonobacteraceae bacterium]